MESNDGSGRIMALLDQMIEQQRAKVLRIGQRLNPRLTPDDLLNPFDWPEVANNPQFNFEDGLLAGLIAARVAVGADGTGGTGAPH